MYLFLLCATRCSPPHAQKSATVLSLIVLCHTTLHVSGCDFTGSNISAVRGHASNTTMFGNLNFSGNRAFAGTAFNLYLLLYDYQIS